ncbi:2-succinyl-5-enolpyruvyl-6-hydroxy-3-cyclohexene-1-carboxylic-acid synthase [Photobacterium halotolerans]|uniref:2-succinyl-5-enolpyruvyl-6-hydroxy-3- cyclohexene-1-carboxylic-acid synthase n=1 Tax=Photobacterium halotolerans TaxID=265726 RepID=UPI001372F8AA|nr:2-succinyl-5-enolpyruvyl-6-hydroxy-3-cyclohexene-1-carboxylic-acid synthase [Photobacterium halotolerans]NAX46245.1 2-succinyl-5-enolpyruvyl-6-hydroxy-3-cyclohexene-1-carboxylic-acid synthase [Photobacterium halotolerans]
MIGGQAHLNRIWARTLLEELSRLGVTEVCLAPGSRSTPLALEADAHPALNLHTHFDERGLGFLALGMAKASGQPVAVIVTSGTAVANLIPAVVEAGLTGEKLVLLTADRPVELIGCGANQAICQPGIFSSHVTASLDLPSPSVTVPLSWLLTSVDELLFRQRQQGGAVHINCPFPEPLYSPDPPDESGYYTGLLAHWRSAEQPFACVSVQPARVTVPDDIQALRSKKTVIIAGDMSVSDAQAVAALAAALACPLLCDPQSGIGSDWAHYDLWLQVDELAAPLNECNLILQFGSRLISKRLTQWIARQVSERQGEYWYVSADGTRHNPDHLPQRHFVAGIADWADKALTALAKTAADDPLPGQTHQQSQQLQPHKGHEPQWRQALRHTAQQVHARVGSYLAASGQMSELALAMDLSHRGQQASLFLGNSLIARLVDMFTLFDGRAVYTNRGASGIDGLVATAAGVQRASGSPLILLLGDTSLLHDLNSLALLTRSKTPVVIVVTNNDGGAIFDLLPVPPDSKQHLYQMPHGYQFEHAARQFGLAYYKTATLSAYQSVVNEHLLAGTGALLVEIPTPPGEAGEQLSQFIRDLHAL